MEDDVKNEILLLPSMVLEVGFCSLFLKVCSVRGEQLFQAVLVLVYSLLSSPSMGM
jgi:hypothetical protein